MQSAVQEQLYCQQVLTAAAAFPESIASQSLQPGNSRNAARLMTHFLCDRLSGDGAVEFVERTTIRWRNGVINIRNAVNTEFWSNLTTSTLERLESLSGESPSAFVLMCWSPETADLHVWAIPGRMIRDGFSGFSVSANGQYRMVRIVPGRNRFETFSDSPDLTPLYRLLSWSDGELTQLNTAFQTDSAVRDRNQNPGIPTDISSVAQQYHVNQVVFRSLDRGARYVVSGVDDKGCTIQRVGGEPARLTWSHFQKKHAALQKSGSFTRRAQLDATVAIHMMMLQSHSIVPAEQGAGVRLLSTLAETLEYVQSRLRTVCRPQILRAAAFLALIEALNSGVLTENSIATPDLFAWLERTCGRSGIVAAPDEILRALAHLADVGLMLFVQNDLTADPCDFMQSRSQFLAAVPRLMLNTALWSVLSSAPERQELCDTLYEIAAVFSVSAGQFQTAKTLQDSVTQLVESIRKSGFIYQPWQIACFVTALRTKPFVILAGVSGTGKTKLPRLIATFTGAPEPLRVAVRPDWTDSSDVLGYVDIQRRFRPGVMLQQLRRAAGDVLNFHTCILDEMNLARVEHYLAEYLSAVEECVPWPTGGFRSTPLLAHIQGEDDAEWSTQFLPPNFGIVGTVNMDETTQAFSRKVLDRAFTIELSDIDLHVMGQLGGTTAGSQLGRWPASWWLARYRRISDVPADCTEFDSILDRVIRVLTQANTVLIQAQMQLGYRTRDEIALFVLNALDVQQSFRTLSNEDVDPLDLAIMMKVLPRLVGSSNLMRQILSGLIDLAQTGSSADVDADPGPTVLQWEALGQPSVFRDAAFPFTLARLCLMYQRLEQQGYTSFWL
jgi:hypothetical protein